MTLHEPDRPVALVTGSTRGLGLATARALGREGMSVVVTGRTEQAAVAAADQLRTQGLDSVLALHLDVTDPVSVFRAFTETQRAFGRLDVLVNNAAVAIDRHRSASRHDLEQITTTVNINLMGAWRCSIEAAALMRAGGGGRILNISSGMASLATMSASSPAYRVSKAALNALTRVLADDLREDNILVNAVSPGVVDTRMNYGAAAVSPDEAAAGMLWLATLPADGPTGGFFQGRERLPW